jgi:hypothetical protein
MQNAGGISAGVVVSVLQRAVCGAHLVRVAYYSYDSYRKRE